MAALLAFDTSTERMAIALVRDEETIGHEDAGGAQASAKLIPALRALLARAGLAPRALDAIAFGCGPGAFTGLRAACAVAQGYAFGLGKPVLALDTLMAVAEDARLRQAVDDVWVASDARMDEIYAAHYRWSQAGWRVERAPALYALDALRDLWCEHDRPRAVAGSALPAFGDRLGAGVLDANVALVPAAQPGAAALAALARGAWRDGALLDPAEALPLYLRDKVALTMQERAATRRTVT